MLSGGLDSAACLKFYLDFGRPLCCLFVDYGQLAAEQEERAVRRVVRHYAAEHRTLRLAGAERKAVGEIACRNAFLVAVAALESPPSVAVIAIGVHAGTSYPDCSPVFLNRMQSVMDLHCGRAIHVAAPFIEWSKAEVFQYGKEHGVPVHLTYSCEAGGSEPCAICHSCRDRSSLDASAQNDA